MAVLTITNNNFEEIVLQSDKPVLLDFWAAWCGPCRMLSPIVEQLAEEDDNFLIGKINVDEEAELAAKFNVMNIPALFVMKEGKVVDSAVGVQPKETLREMLQSTM